MRGRYGEEHVDGSLENVTGKRVESSLNRQTAGQRIAIATQPHHPLPIAAIKKKNNDAEKNTILSVGAGKRNPQSVLCEWVDGGVARWRNRSFGHFARSDASPKSSQPDW